MAHILIIDDDDLVIESTQIMLEHLGHSVVSENHAQAGLNRAKAESFDLVITDIIMPDKDGLEVVTEIKSLKPTQKIIAISGGGRASASSYLEAAKDLGANEVLSKPFSFTELEANVGHLLAL